MIKIIKSLLILLFLASFSFQAYSETSWITKKDKTKKTLVKKNEAKDKKNEWIKKKLKKEKKVIKKVKEKIKESKSWITKKTKKEKKLIKEELKKSLTIYSLPKAELYFAAKIIPKDENEEVVYFYGYVKSDNKSDTFQFNNNSYYKISNGAGYFEDQKTSCEINAQTGVLFGKMKGDIVFECTNDLTITGDFKRDGDIVIGTGKTTKANDVEFEFHNSKKKIINKLDSYKKSNKVQIARSLPAPANKSKINIIPEGKYYALIIANSNYNNKEIWSDLKSPSRDAIAIKKILDKKYKFTDSWLIEDASRIEIHEEFKKLKDIVTDKDYLLIYYVGHGAEVNGEPYWVPVEGGENYFEWVNVNSLTNDLSEIKARDILIMIDSCYSGLSFQTKSSNKKDIDNSTAAIKDALINYSRKVLTSGHNEKVNDTYYDKEHSLFALGFIKILNENESNVTAESIYFDIKKLHQLDVNIPQVPKYGTINNLKLTLKDMAKGEFVFHVPN
jgi:hypothetical protein